MYQVKLSEATSQLAALIDAAIRDEVVLITTNDQQTIQLVPIKQAKQPRRFGSAKGQIHMSDNFDEPIDDFREYTV